MKVSKDKKLKTLLKEVKLDSPKADFSDRVMNRIIQEEYVSEKIRSQRILGKNFWIIPALFVLILLAAIVVSTLSPTIGGNRIIDSLPSFNIEAVYNSYTLLIQKIERLPLSIASILFAISILLFFDHFVSSKIVNQ